MVVVLLKPRKTPSVASVQCSTGSSFAVVDDGGIASVLISSHL